LAAGIVAYWLLRKRLLVFGFLLFLTVIVGTVFWLRSNERFVEFSNDYKSTIYHKNFREHLIATYRLKDLSNAERIYRWIAAVRMVRDSWQTGFGPSTFYHQYKSYTLPAFKTYVSDNKEQSTVHNYFLLTLIEQGILGCLLFVSLLIALLSYCQRIYFRTKEKFWRVVISASASVLIMQCVINFLSDMIETDKVGSIFYLCIAVIIIADLKTRKEISDPSANIESIP
jgi:O-antigen ligase